MNDGMRFAATPKTAKGKKPRVPLEVKVMAQQLGLSPGEMAQADQMWEKLNTLSTKDPKSYQKLVKASAKHMEQKEDDTKVEEADEAVEKVMKDHFMDGKKEVMTPTAGYVIKTRTKKGDKVMVNCCGHSAVEPPIDNASGRAVPLREIEDDRRWQGAQGLHIPMVVSEVRPCVVAAADKTKTGKAVDVVFHPWVLRRCTRDPPFKAEVSALALRWADAERHLNLETTWKYIQSTYKGGDGPSGNEPLPFPIDAAKDQTKPIKDRPKADLYATTTGVTATPESLLSRMRAAKNDEENDDVDLHISPPEPPTKEPTTTEPKKKKVLIEEISPPEPPTKKPTTEQKKKVLIEEIPGDDVLEVDDKGGFDISSGDLPEPPKQPQKKTKPAVKKGFLKDKKKPLYPKGSEQGQKEGSYSRFLGKCNVVDTTQMTKEQQTDAVRAHALGEPKKKDNEKMDQKTKLEGFKKGFFKEGDKKKKKGIFQEPPPVDANLERLMDEADPEYSRAATAAAKAEAAEVDETLAQLREFSEKLSLFDRPKPKTLQEYNATPEGGGVAESKQCEKPSSGFQRGFLGGAPDANADPPEQPKNDDANNKDNEDNNKTDDAKNDYDLTELEPTEDGRRRLKLTATIAGATSFADVTLDVSERLVRIKAARFKVKVPLAMDIDPNMTKAKFLKKSSLLSITLLQAQSSS